MKGERTDMYLIEKEIKDQFSAMDKTVALVKSQEEQIVTYFGSAKKIIVLGCGSSYMIGKSAASLILNMTGISAYAIAAGDLLLNANIYKTLIKDASLLVLSRSGSTTEILLAVQSAMSLGAKECLSVCAAENAEISALCTYNLEIPWSFDKSVCQTRTVTNLYAAVLTAVALHVKDREVLGALEKASGYYASFALEYDDTLKDIAKAQWSHGVVIADGMASGLAEEGALAFKEICQCNSNHYHVLDVRHGPMVMISKDTLVLQLITSDKKQLQYDLLTDLKKKGAVCVIFDSAEAPRSEADFSITLPQTDSPLVSVLFMMYAVQVVTYERALQSGVNPDNPDGLDAWIELK